LLIQLWPKGTNRFGVLVDPEAAVLPREITSQRVEPGLPSKKFRLTFRQRVELPREKVVKWRLFPFLNSGSAAAAGRDTKERQVEPVVRVQMEQAPGPVDPEAAEP